MVTFADWAQSGSRTQSAKPAKPAPPDPRLDELATKFDAQQQTTTQKDPLATNAHGGTGGAGGSGGGGTGGSGGLTGGGTGSLLSVDPALATAQLSDAYGTLGIGGTGSGGGGRPATGTGTLGGTGNNKNNNNQNPFGRGRFGAEGFGKPVDPQVRANTLSGKDLLASSGAGKVTQLPQSASLWQDLMDQYGGSLKDALTAADLKGQGEMSRMQRRASEMSQGSALGGAAQGAMAQAGLQAASDWRQSSLDAQMQWASKGLEMKQAMLQQMLGSEEAAKDRDLQRELRNQMDETQMQLRLIDQGWAPQFDENGNIVGVSPGGAPSVGGGEAGEPAKGTRVEGQVINPVSNAQEIVGPGDPMEMTSAEQQELWNQLPPGVQQAAYQAMQAAVSEVSAEDGGDGFYGPAAEQAKNLIGRYITWIVASEGRIPQTTELMRMLRDQGLGGTPQ